MSGFAIADLALDPPRVGDRELHHDETFTTWDRVFSGVRDGINLAIDHLNHVGAGLPRLPDGSLEDLLVVPLTGDYRLIRQNGNACAVVQDAMSDWAANIGWLAHESVARWHGASGLAFAAHLEAYDLVVRAAGRLIGLGRQVFDGVADVSERLGVQAERIIVALGRLLRRLAIRIAEKLAGAGGWAKLALDLVTKGLRTVTDILDDIRLVVELIDAAVEVRDAIREWAEVQRARLEILADLPDLLRALPELGAPGAADPEAIERLRATARTAGRGGTAAAAAEAIGRLRAAADEGLEAGR